MKKISSTIDIPPGIMLSPFASSSNKIMTKILNHFKDVKIHISYDEVIHLYGPQEDIDKCTTFFEAFFQFLYLNKNDVTLDDVDLLLRQNDAGLLAEGFQDTDVIFQIGKYQVKAKTQHQKDYVNAIENNTVTFAIGVAGSAKSYLAVVSAIKALRNKEVSKIIVTRPPVALDGLELGFIPGTDKDKMSPWIAPLIDVLGKFYSLEQIEHMFEKGTIESVPLAYVRGRSFENCFIIVDEAQNASINVFKSILTRLGTGSKIVICGDTQQTDIDKNSGLEIAARIMEGADGVAIIRMGFEDIVRSGLTAEVIKRFTSAGY